MAGIQFSTRLLKSLASSPVSPQNISRFRNVLPRTPNSSNRLCVPRAGDFSQGSPVLRTKFRNLLDSSVPSPNTSHIPKLYPNFIKACEESENSSEACIARGAFGKVRLVLNQGLRYAVKHARKSSDSKIGEQNALGLSHPNITQIFYVRDMEANRRLVIMEYGGDRNLQNMIGDLNVNWTNALKVKFLVHICKGLDYCHQHLLHLDLKPLNIIVEKGAHCRITDFGSSIKVPVIEPCQNLGTPAYTSPEQFQNMLATVKCDIYSFSIIIWQLITLQEPYKDLDRYSLIYQVVKNNLRPSLPSFRNSQEKFLGNIMTKCWAKDPNERPTLQFLLDSLNSYKGLPLLDIEC